MVSCHAKKEKDHIPQDIVSTDSMVMLLTDIHLAESEAFLFPYSDSLGTTNLPSYYHYILKQHGIDTSTFKKSFDYYLHHPDVLTGIYSNVIEELSKRQAHYQKKNQ
jgi:hypothetical protein